MLIDDEWSGLADLLANLIAKYASELSIDDMPTPNYKKDYSSNEKKLLKSHICCFRKPLIQF